MVSATITLRRGCHPVANCGGSGSPDLPNRYILRKLFLIPFLSHRKVSIQDLTLLTLDPLNS